MWRPIVFTMLLVVPMVHARAGECVDTPVIPKIILATGSTSEDERVQRYLNQLPELQLFASCKTRGSYLYYSTWYERHAPVHRYTAQSLAILVLILGALLPVITHVPRANRFEKLLVALVGAAIVIAQGTSQVFNNDNSWRAYTVSKMKLEFALAEWQHEIVKAAQETNALQLMQDATERFEKNVEGTVLEETSGFFTTRRTATSSGAASDQKAEH